MGVTAGIVFGAGEVAADTAAAVAATDIAATAAADFTAMGALGDFSAMTLADVALPSAVSEAAAGTLAYAAPEVAGAIGSTLEGAAAPFVEGIGAEGGPLATGVPSTVEATTSAIPGVQTTTAAQQALASAPAGVTSGTGGAAGFAAPAGTLPEEYLGTTPFQVGAPAEVTSLTPSGAPIVDTAASPLTPTTAGMTTTTAAAQTPVIGGEAVSSGLTAAPAATSSLEVAVPQEVAQTTAPSVFSSPGAGSQLSSSLANAGYSPSQALAGDQFALGPSTGTATDATVGGQAVTQAPAAYNPQGALPSMAQQGVPTVAPQTIAETAPAATTAPATTAPATSAGTSIGEGSSGLTSQEIGAGKAATGASQAASAAGGEGFGSSIVDYLKKNPSLLLSGAGLAYNMMNAQQPPKFQPQMSAAAQNMQAQGTQLASYLSTGTLPPGVQANLNAARDAAVATVQSNHAARGTSGSSMEAQDIQRINETIVSQGATIATQLLQAGISEQQMAAGIYQNLMQASLQQDAQMSSAISNFTNALAYGAARNLTPVG